jgi:AraC family L-rhamnose operon regulatory protein RhaS
LKAVPVELPPSDLLLTLFKEGAKLANERSVSSARVRNTLGAATFNEYFRLAHLEEEERKIPVSVYRAKRFLDEHFAEECDLGKVASKVGLSPHYLLQLFKGHVGVTPTRYMWKLRAQKGIHLLQQSGLTISEIAYSCGFKTPHHFSRVLKQNYGYSPSQMREKEWMRDPARFNKDIPDVHYK